MISSTSHVFLKEIGGNHFQKVDDCDEMDTAQIFHLAVRKKRFVWSRYHYDPRQFQIQEILSGGPLEAVPIATTLLLKNFNFSSKFKVSGEVGAALASFLSMELNASDDITLSLPLGDIMKHELDLPKFVALLKGRQVDLANPLVSQCMHKKGAGLSVIVETLFLQKDATITASANVLADADAKTKGGTANADINVDDVRKAEVNLQAGTVIAYRCLDLQINATTGLIHCQLSGLARSCKPFCCRGDKIDSIQSETEYLYPREVREWHAICGKKDADFRTSIFAFCESSGDINRIWKRFAEEAGQPDVKAVPELNNIYTAAACHNAETPGAEKILHDALAVIFESLVALPDDLLWQLPLLCIEDVRTFIRVALAQLQPNPEHLAALVPEHKNWTSSRVLCDISRIMKLDVTQDGCLEFSGDTEIVEAFVRVLVALFPSAEVI